MVATHQFVNYNGASTVLISHIVGGEKIYVEIPLKRGPALVGLMRKVHTIFSKFYSLARDQVRQSYWTF